MIRRELLLEGLDCSNCAAKIEAGVNKISGVSSASMNFATRTLSIEAGYAGDIDNIVASANGIIKKFEPGVSVKIIGNNKQNEEKNVSNINKLKIVQLGIGAALFLTASLFNFPFRVGFGMFLSGYILAGGEVLLKAAGNITRGRVFDENFLMSIATIGAFAIGEFSEGVAVMLFYQVGEFIQSIAVNRSRKSIAALMDIRPDFANLKTVDGLVKVSPDEVAAGDIIVVKPGERIPLDGIVTEGKSMLDTSALTGESVPREVTEGNEVLSGSINKNGLLSIKVTKKFGESTVSKILDLVQNAAAKKAPTENFITRFARYYTPVVVFTAAALAVIPPLIVPGAAFSDWFGRALVFLVVSCPCALVISIPLSFFGGIGGASKNGILIKGGNYLEVLNNLDTIVFDKTGTLTKGVFKATKVNSFDKTPGMDLLEYAAYAESYSNHPIALSIVNAFGHEIDKNRISEYEEISGHGIRVKVDGRLVLAGNTKLMAKESINCENTDEAGTIVHIAIDGKYSGYIVISDEVRDDSKIAIQTLRKIGVRRLVMLTGDSKAVGEKYARELGLDEVHAELLPDQKVEKLEMLNKQKPSKGKLAFVGDGINDAPVLARADVGIAMGGTGSDAAIESADVVLMTDEPLKLVSAIKISKRTRRIVWQNIIFAMAIKVIVLLLGAGGVATIWEAVFADVGVTIIAVLNAMRVMKTGRP